MKKVAGILFLLAFFGVRVSAQELSLFGPLPISPAPVSPAAGQSPAGKSAVRHTQAACAQA